MAGALELYGGKTTTMTGNASIPCKLTAWYYLDEIQ
jgi:hypothetical protein